MRVLVIDDLREFKSSTFEAYGEGQPEVTYARTPEDGVDFLRAGGWNAVYLDHDLGLAGDVKPCLDYILEFRDEFPDTLFYVHTSNSYEKDSMMRQLNARNLRCMRGAPECLFNINYTLWAAGNA